MANSRALHQNLVCCFSKRYWGRHWTQPNPIYPHLMPSTAAFAGLPPFSPDLLYFSYGSNMSRDKMPTRGDQSTPPIEFVSVHAARLPDFRLTFDIRFMLPYEPVFASVETARGDETYGVVYKIKDEPSWPSCFAAKAWTILRASTKLSMSLHNASRMVEINRPCTDPWLLSWRAQMYANLPGAKIVCSSRDATCAFCWKGPGPNDYRSSTSDVWRTSLRPAFGLLVLCYGLLTLSVRFFFSRAGPRFSTLWQCRWNLGYQ